jgi:hypothetical protein
MTMRLLRKLLTSLCMAVLCLSTGAVAKPADDDFNAQAAGFLKSLREKYDALPESGKFATGACIGFGGSRLAVKSAVSVVKIAGAAFVT